MRRILGSLVVLLAAAGFALLAGGAGDGMEDATEYRVELDNAFGLIEGGDFKIAGVRAGKITEMDLDRRTKRALVGFRIDKEGFGSLRADVTCNVAPQSLVGEYFVDCQPGTSPRKLPKGSTIPVEQTTSVVPPDLVGNIMRRPYRERFRIILGSLGAGLAGNGRNLNEAIRRAVPALRETDEVLAILARQNQVLADLVRDADDVLDDLAANRGDVARFVVEARDAAAASAERDDDIAAGWRRLPTFLRELRPTMAELGRTADAQGPALENLARSAPQLERLFDNLEPFAEASRPALRSLGEASKTGRSAVQEAGSTVAELRRLSTDLPELSKNLAIVLEHLERREHSVEDDPRSPGGKGYTGLEAILQYIFDQATSTNIHDGEVNYLKAFGFEGHCAAYADLERAEEEGKECSTALGPNVVGLTYPDPTAPKGWDKSDRGPEESDPSNPPGADDAKGDAPRKRRSASTRSSRRDEGDKPRKQASGLVPVPDVKELLPEAEPQKVPRVEAPKVSDLPVAAPRPTLRKDEPTQRRLLDFLLGP